MNHITQEAARELSRLASAGGLNEVLVRDIHALCNAAIEWYIAQQAAPDPLVSNDLVICPECCSQFRAIPVNVQKLMLDAGFEPPFTEAPKHIGNVDSVDTSQERVRETAKSEQVPLTDEQITVLLRNFYGTCASTQDRLFARAIEAAHGIGVKV